MKILQYFSLIGFIALALTSCEEKPVPKLVFKFKFDTTQVRLDNIGNPAVMPSNHRGQHPKFNKMSAHYIELAPNANTMLGNGTVLYLAPSTGSAIDFDQSVKVGENENFFTMPLKDISPGTYQWLRISLAYQNYDIQYRVGPPAFPSTYDGVGTLASFIGYNTHITSYVIKNQSVTINNDKLQGYWGFESVGSVVTGQAPPGATTVPNPIFATSPIPAGSCVVTASFSSPLTITGNETEDVEIIVSLSINKSFEWIESGGNNLYEPLNGDTVIDMGIRGMIPIVQ
jgi:hypothetical protein